MKKLLEEIKSGQLKQVYILYGEEAYLRNQYKNRLKDALLAGGDTMNFHYFEGKNIRVGELIDLAQTMPFLAERRVILLENSGLFAHGGAGSTRRRRPKGVRSSLPRRTKRR